MLLQGLLRAAIASQSREQIPTVIDIVQQTGALQYVKDQALAHKDQAIASLAHFTDSAYVTQLCELADLAVQRDQ